MIRVDNIRNLKLKRNEIIIKVDRSSVLGNPFYMSDESQRGIVCDKYEEYFYDVVNNSMLAQMNMSDNEINKFINELDRIYELSKSNNIVLACWCYPKRCHAETIKSYIEGRLK